MSAFTQYRRKQIAELRPYEPGETLNPRVSISAADLEAGSPKIGDMIARNPKNHDDMWLVAADYFADNFEAIGTDDPDLFEALDRLTGEVFANMGAFESEMRRVMGHTNFIVLVERVNAARAAIAKAGAAS